MKFKPMNLERWLLKPCEINVGGGGVTKLKLKDITTDIDYEQLLDYGVTNGSERLRKEIANWYSGVKPDNVLVTTATSEANLLTHFYLLNSEDEYVTECPLYQQSVGLAESLGCKIKQFSLIENEGWKPDLEQLKKLVTKKTKIISFNNPNNPTGALLSDQEMRAICEIAEDVDAYVICDNALRGSELGGTPAITPFEFYDKGVITGSISKLGMTGPRIGWLIGKKDFVNACWVLKDYTTLSHSGIGEYLSIIALRRENRLKYIRRNLEISKANLSILSKWIDNTRELVSWVPPKAGFTAFPKYNLPFSSEEFCKKLLEEENVLISPGEYFGVDQHFRINFGCDERILAEALKRLETFMNRHGTH